MDKRKIVRYSKYLISRIFGFVLLYQVCMNRYIHSSFYRTLKDTLYQITGSERNDNENACLLRNPFYHQFPTTFSRINCLNCETITEIKKIYYASYSDIHSLYLKQNIPVIVIDAMFEWPALTDTFSIDNFTEIYRKARYQNILPCELSSSMNWYSTNYLSEIFDDIFQIPFHSWFISWKNCDLTSAKAIRYFYQQPYFVKYFVPAARINSAVIYSNYNQSLNYKQFIVEGRKLLLLMQIRGSLNLKLVPKQCVNVCNTIVGRLEESQILVLSSELWQLKYSSSSHDTNIAILTENDLDK